MLEDPSAQPIFRLGPAGGVGGAVCHACAADLDEARGRVYVATLCAFVLVGTSTHALSARREAETVTRHYRLTMDRRRQEAYPLDS